MNTSIEKLAKVGSSLGLSGSDLKEWIEKTVKDEDDRKQRELEAERAKTDKEVEIEKERAKFEAEKAHFDMERVKLETERIREETALVTLQLELGQQRRENRKTDLTAINPEASSHTTSIKLPKLPTFNPDKDNLQDYLQRFERHARLNGWKEEDWATHLSALLTGSSLEVYSRLNDEEANDYSVLKTSLLKRYSLTEDGFLDKFRRSRPEVGETIEQFGNRITSYFEKWIEMAGKNKESTADIIDLLMKEQLMNVCGRELLVFVRERKPTDARSVIDLISTYVDAHGSVGAYTKTSLSKPKQDNDSSKLERPDSHTESTVGLTHRSGLITCRACNKPGHVARDCKSRGAATTSTITCSYCMKANHRAIDCRKRQYDEGRQRPLQVASMSLSTNQEAKQDCSHYNQEHLEFMCGCTLPVTKASCVYVEGDNNNMPIANGLLDGRPVSILRDSGCSNVVIRKGIAHGSSRGTQKVPVLLADGSVQAATTVDVNIDCPYFKGTVSAVELEHSLYDVILGNLPGAKCPDMCQKRSVLAVDAPKSKHKETKTQVTSLAPTMDVTTEDFKAQQEADVSLAKPKELAVRREVRINDNQNKQWYEYKEGILYRHYTSPNGHRRTYKKQVVVPKGLRNTVMKLAHESVSERHLSAKQTSGRIQEAYYWPSMWTDVRKFCRSCEVCQQCTQTGKTPTYLSQGKPLIDNPISRVDVDLAGTITPANPKIPSKRQALTMIYEEIDKSRKANIMSKPGIVNKDAHIDIPGQTLKCNYDIMPMTSGSNDMRPDQVSQTVKERVKERYRNLLREPPGSTHSSSVVVRTVDDANRFGVQVKEQNAMSWMIFPS